MVLVGMLISALAQVRLELVVPLILQVALQAQTLKKAERLL
jgi:hypothetical protein